MPSSITGSILAVRPTFRTSTQESKPSSPRTRREAKKDERTGLLLRRFARRAGSAPGSAVMVGDAFQGILPGGAGYVAAGVSQGDGNRSQRARRRHRLHRAFARNFRANWRQRAVPFQTGPFRLPIASDGRKDFG